MNKPLATEPNLARLPVELLELIATHLGRPEFYQLALTCRQLSTAFTPHLWRKLLLGRAASCESVPRALQARPALAYTVTELDIFCLEDVAVEDDDRLYNELAIAALLPNLKRLDVNTPYLEFDQDRSRKAAQELSRLEYLETCSLIHQHGNGDHWHGSCFRALPSLMKHPSMREMTLDYMSGGLADESRLFGDDTRQKRSTPLRKLSLLNCDLDPIDVADMMNDCSPVEFELIYSIVRQNGSHYRYDTADYIEAIKQAGRTSLERLTYYRYWDKFELSEEVPHWTGFDRLKYLSVDPEVLLGYDAPNEYPYTQRPLPPQLEVLELMFFSSPYDDDKIIPYAKELVAQRNRQSSNLREMRFRTLSIKSWSSSELQELQQLGEQNGLVMTFGCLPQEWVEDRRWSLEH